MIAAPSIARFLLPAAMLALSACNVSGLQVATYDGGPAYGSYGSPYGYGYGSGYLAPGYRYGYEEPAYRRGPRGSGFPDYYGSSDRGWRDGGWSRRGWERSRYQRSYANNGRCDDARYRTSNGGRADPGTDERDCRKYGDGRK